MTCKTIWKFSTPITRNFMLDMPVGSKPLHVGMPDPQLYDIYMWATCNPSAKKSLVRFSWYGTGQPMPENPGDYVGTVLTHQGAYVWHLYKDANQ